MGPTEAAWIPEAASIEVEVVRVVRPDPGGCPGGQGDLTAPAMIVRETLSLPAGSRVAAVLDRINDATTIAAGLASGALALAIYGERCDANRVLRDGDRIEILAALIADPKQSRGRRADVQRARKGDARWGRRSS